MGACHGYAHRASMTTPVHSAERPVRLSSTTTIPIGAVLAGVLVLASAMLYMGMQLQRIDTIDTEVREMRREIGELRTLLIRQTGR